MGIAVGIYLNEKILETIDKARGPVKRSQAIRLWLEHLANYPGVLQAVLGIKVLDPNESQSS